MEPEEIRAFAERWRTVNVEGLLEANPNLDRDRVRRIVSEFAAALDTPQILGDLESIFARIPPGA